MGSIVKYNGSEVFGDNGVKLIKYLGMVKRTDESNKKYIMGIFECPVCNKEFKTTLSSVKHGSCKSCDNCNNKVINNKQYINYEPGTVIGDNNVKLIKDLGMIYTTEKSNKSRRTGLFECPNCKGHFKTTVPDVKSGNTKGCKSCSRTTHGLGFTKIYKIWAGMRSRCHNQKDKGYLNYGGRGITVCDEWLKDVKVFHKWCLKELDGRDESLLGKGIGKLTIDRTNVNGNYCPENCRFATIEVQARNKRKIKKNNVSGYKGIGHNDTRYRAWVRVDGKDKILSYHLDKWSAAKAYDQYVKDNNLENSTNDLSEPTIVIYNKLNSLKGIPYTYSNEHFVTGLLTRILNGYDVNFILEKLSKFGINNLNINLISKNILSLVKDHKYKYAVVEKCLRGSTIINLHL